MESEALLLGLTEVSIAITGFRGVVGAVSGRTWGEAERFRLISLTSFATAATLVEEMGGAALLKKIEEDPALGAGGIDALREQAPDPLSLVNDDH